MFQRQFLILVALLSTLLGPLVAFSANQVLWTTQASKLFADTTQTPDVKLTWSGLPPLNGQVSAVWDRGSGALSTDIEYRCSIQLTGSLNPAESVELWYASSNGTLIDGPVTADSRIDAATTPALRNVINSLHLAGQLTVNKATTNTAMNYAGVIHNVTGRYFYLVAWNMTSFTVRADATVNNCRLTPLVPEIQ
jgi:hypothetical protein